MITTFYFYCNCNKFPKKGRELQKIKKKHVKHGKTRTEKVILTHEEHKTLGTRGTWVTKHVRHKDMYSTSHVRHESTKGTSYARREGT